MDEELYGGKDPLVTSSHKKTINTAKTLNPDNDFKKLKISKPAQTQRKTIDEEITEYEGQISEEEWDMATSHIEESAHYMHMRLTAFWESMKDRFPKLSGIALQVGFFL